MSAFSGNVISPDTGDLAAPDVPPGKAAITGRSLRSLAWSRLKKDKLALAGGIVVAVLLVVAVLAPIICKILGIDPNLFPNRRLTVYS